MSTNHSDSIPNFITARTLKGLRLLMFKRNADAGAFVKYFDISSYVDKTGKLKWVAWYYERVEDAVKEL